MADPKIRIRRSATPNKVPSTTQLQLGELAINTYDGKVYLEQDQGGVGVGTTVIAINPWSVGVGSTAYNTHFLAGKAGIGTTNAQYNLDVGGNINFTGNLYQDGSLYTSGTTGIGIGTAGGVVGYAATIVHFKGPGVTTAYYSSATGIGTINFHSVTTGGGGGGASVTVSDSAPGSPSNGDLWFKSDVGELYVYYTDGSSNQWVEASGGSNTCVTSDTAPTSPQDGDLWWNSNTGELKIYYNDGNSSQWVDANSEGGFLQYWTQTNTNGTLGVTTTSYVGIGTTTATDALTVVGAADIDGNLIVSGVTTIAGQTDLNGHVNLGNALTDPITVNGKIDSALIPWSDDGYDLGTSGTQWRHLYVDGTADLDSVTVSGVSTFSNTVDINSNLDVSGNATIGGVLTYEDVRNVDSIGIVTARTGIKVLAGGANIVDGTTTDELNVTGVSTFAGAIDANGDLDVDGHTNLDNASVAGIATFSKSGSALRLNDGSILRLGNVDSDFFLYHDGGTVDYISAGAGKQLRLTTDDFIIKGAGNTETLMTAVKDGPVHLYHNNISRLSTSSVGVSISQDLDVDGITNLDDVNISGVTTATGGVKVGTAATICSEGNMTIDRPSAGIITATKFIGDGSDLTGVISGIGIGTAGGVVGYAATIVHFKGAGVTTAYYNAATGIGTVFFHSTAGGGGGNANVTIADAPPGSPSAGDLWWESDIGELKIYYNDGNSSQWVDASGADSLVQIGTSAPTGAVSGDLWWNSESGDLMVYYTDANSSAWISVNAVNSERIWSTNSTGIHTSRSVGIGTTTVTDPLTVVGATDLDGTLLVSGITTFGSHVYHGDNDRAIFGDGSDLEIYHSGTKSIINDAGTGSLELQVGGSTKLETTVGGAKVWGTVGSANTALVVVGDARITGIVTVGTGSLKITDRDINAAGIITASSFDGHFNGTGKDVVTRNLRVTGIGTFDGNLNVLGTLTYEDVKNVDSAGIATARQGLRITGGGLDVVGVSTFNDNVKLLDNDELKLGTGSDLKVYHTGSHSYIDNTSTGGNLYIRQYSTSSDKSIILGGASSHKFAEFIHQAAVNLYHNNSKKFETRSGGVTVTGGINLSGELLNNDHIQIQADSKHLIIGAGDDLRAYHNGSNSIVNNNTGTLFVQSDNISFKDKDDGDFYAKFIHDGAVELYHDNSKKLETTAAGITVSGHIDLDDSNFLKAGTGDDLWVGHDGSHSYINHNGTGGLFVQSSGGFFVQKYGTTERLINANNDGSVEIFYDSAKKLETTTNGVSVTGKLAATGDIDSGTGYYQITSGTTRFSLTHDGANCYLENQIGAFYVKTPDNTNVVEVGNSYLALPNDNDKIKIGASGDLELFHDGGSSIIRNTNDAASLYLQASSAGTTNIKCNPNGSTQLFHNGTITLYTATNAVRMHDNVKLDMGNASDFQIYHNGGSGNYIDSINKDLYLRCNLDNSITGGDIVLQPKSGENSGIFRDNAGVELFYDNVQKFETNGEGINVTGRTTWSGGTSAQTQSVYLSAGTSNPTQIGMYNGHGGKQGFCFYNNGSGSYTSWGMITDQQNLYFKSAPYNIGNTSDLTTNWNDRMTLSNAGRLGVGTNNPFNKLTLKGNGDDIIDIIYSGTSGNHESRIQFRDKRDFVNAQINNNLQDDGSGTGAAHLEFKTATSGSLSTRLQIDRNGVFTFNPGGRLHVRGGTTNGSEDTVMWIDKQNNNDWLLKLECGTGSSTDYGLYVRANNSANYAIAVHNLSAWKFRVAGNGTIYSANTSVQSISDVRLKENIVDANSQWDDIKGLRFRNYNWKADSGHADGKTYLGLIAQEVETISPNLVEIDAQDKEDIDNGVPDPEYKNVNYSIVWMKAVKALQEAQARIETLEAEVAALKSS